MLEAEATKSSDVELPSEIEDLVFGHPEIAKRMGKAGVPQHPADGSDVASLPVDEHRPTIQDDLFATTCGAAEYNGGSLQNRTAGLDPR